MSSGPVVVIGGGEGSVSAARRLLKSLPSGFPAGVLLHLMPAAGDRDLDPMQLLQPQSGLPSAIAIAMAKDGDPMLKGRALVVPPACTAVFSREGILRVTKAESTASHPVDTLFTSAAAAFHQALIGVLLSGAGNDGTAGFRAIKAAGGISMVQSPADSENAGMPMSALLGDQPDYSALIQQIGPLLVQFAHRGDVQRR